MSQFQVYAVGIIAGCAAGHMTGYWCGVQSGAKLMFRVLCRREIPDEDHKRTLIDDIYHLPEFSELSQ